MDTKHIINIIDNAEIRMVGRDIEDGCEHTRWLLILKDGKKRVQLRYKTGTGIKRRPTAWEILEALLKDARAGTEFTLMEFIHERGYEDVTLALNTYLACQATYHQIVSFFGYDGYEHLQQVIEEDKDG